MSKVSEIREICGDYAFDVEYYEGHKFTMFFNSRRNAETVKRCIEVDDSVPNAATAVDFVEVVRCKDCAHYHEMKGFDYKGRKARYCVWHSALRDENDYCSDGMRISERSENGK
jgi:hypothetical protein